MKRFFFIFFFLALLFLIGTVKNTFAQTVCPAGGQCRNYNTNALCVAAGGTPQFCTGNLGLGNCCIPAAPTSTPTPTPTPITCPSGRNCANTNTTALCIAAGGIARPCAGPPGVSMGNCCMPAAPTSIPTPTRTQNPCPGGGNCANTNTAALCTAAGGTARACTGPPGVSIGNCCRAPTPTPTPGLCPIGSTCRSYVTPDLCDSAGGTPKICRISSGGMGNCCVPKPSNLVCNSNSTGIRTAIGCFPVISKDAFTKYLLIWGIGIAGGIGFLLIVYGGFMVTTSSGDPKRLSAGKELITASLMGLTLLLFGVYILKLIGVDILGIPGLQ